MPASFMLAVGRKGLPLQIPDGVTATLHGAELDPSEGLRLSEQRDIIREALRAPTDAPSLEKLVDGKRRVCIVAGDLSHPAPYSVALPAVTQALVDAGIRPSRISVLVCPGDCGPLLGRAAIRRYGEEIAGDFELRPMQNPEALKPDADEAFAGACVRIVLQPAGAPALLTPESKVDLFVELKLSRRARTDITAARVYSNFGQVPTMLSRPAIASDVLLTTGGGDDWENSLEEALLSLHSERLAPVTVLAFGGRDGLGSAIFTRNVEDSLGALERGTLQPDALGGYRPVRAFESALTRTEMLVLFCEGLAEHPDSEDLTEWLADRPKAAAKLKICTSQLELWETLRAARGENFSIAINPLGWRGNL